MLCNYFSLSPPGRGQGEGCAGNPASAVSYGFTLTPALSLKGEGESEVLL